MGRPDRRFRSILIGAAIVLPLLFGLNYLFPEWFGGRWW